LVLAQKQTWRTIEQIRRWKKKCTQLKPQFDFWQRSICWGKKPSIFNKCHW
jgi:hypothetical protein